MKEMTKIPHMDFCRARQLTMESSILVRPECVPVSPVLKGTGHFFAGQTEARNPARTSDEGHVWVPVCMSIWRWTSGYKDLVGKERCDFTPSLGQTNGTPTFMGMVFHRR